MKTVFLFVKNPIFISDILRTSYIEYLASRYRVVVFSSSVDALTGRYFSSKNVEYVKWSVQNRRLLMLAKFFRTNCIHEFDGVSSLKFYYASSAFRGDKRARIARLLSWPFARWLTTDFFTRLERRLIGRSSVFDAYCDKYRPSLVITSTPGIQGFDAEAILLAGHARIPTVATNFSWDNLNSFKCVRVRKPDYLFVWNDIIRRSAINLHHFDPSGVFLAGSMRFDKYFNSSVLPSREDFLVSKGLNPGNKTILFATAGRRSDFQLETILNILRFREQGLIPYVNLLVRVHPLDIYDSYGLLRGQKDVCVERAGKEITDAKGNKAIEMDKGDFVNLKATLTYTDLNINYKSTITLESFLFDKPVINFINPTLPFQNQHYFDPSSYYAPIMKYGSIFLAKDGDELLAGINMYLQDPQKDSANRRQVADLFFAFRDGLSYKRNVDFIGRII